MPSPRWPARRASCSSTPAIRSGRNLAVDEARDVLAALTRLGFRFEPAEGWHAGRAPTPSDLAMALAYAGLDARNVRGLPSAAELRTLPSSIGVDARAFLATFAPDLAMDQLVRLARGARRQAGTALGCLGPRPTGPAQPAPLAGHPARLTLDARSYRRSMTVKASAAASPSGRAGRWPPSRGCARRARSGRRCWLAWAWSAASLRSSVSLMST